MLTTYYCENLEVADSLRDLAVLRKYKIVSNYSACCYTYFGVDPKCQSAGFYSSGDIIKHGQKPVSLDVMLTILSEQLPSIKKINGVEFTFYPDGAVYDGYQTFTKEQINRASDILVHKLAFVVDGMSFAFGPQGWIRLGNKSFSNQEFLQFISIYKKHNKSFK